MALLNQNEDHVITCLSDIMQTSGGLLSCQEFPLHLSICWPKGLSLLLTKTKDQNIRSVINMQGPARLTPLRTAIIASQADSALILLDHGASIGFEDLCTFNLFSAEHDSRLHHIIARHLTQKDHLLRQFAISVYGTSRDHIDLSQQCTYDIQSSLEHDGFRVPDYLRTSCNGTLYHVPFLRPQTAEHLFSEGAGSPDMAVNGITPIMTIRLGGRHFTLDDLLNQVAWFISHGVCINDPIPRPDLYERNSDTSNQSRVVHRLGALLSAQPDISSWSNVISEERYPYIQTILKNHHRDTCSCYCAPYGCRAADIFARDICIFSSIGHYSPWGELPFTEFGTRVIMPLFLEPSFQPFSGVAYLISGIKEIAYSASISSTVPIALIRCLTFQRLGMKHTCCNWRYLCQYDNIFKNSMDLVTFMEEGLMDTLNGKRPLVDRLDADEIAELQDEDKYLANDLEDIMKDFESQLKGSDSDFVDFILGYWWDKMDAYESQKEDIPSKEKSMLRNFGIWLDGG